MANISLRHCKWQDVPPPSQRKLPQMQSQLPSILLGTAQRSLSSDKVYSTASAQEKEQKKYHLKMLRGVLPQGHGHCWPRASTNTALVNTFQPGHCSCSSWAGRQTDWQAGRQTDWQAGRQTGRQEAAERAGSCSWDGARLNQRAPPAAPWPTRGNTEGICP